MVTRCVIIGFVVISALWPGPAESAADGFAAVAEARRAGRWRGAAPIGEIAASPDAALRTAVARLLAVHPRLEPPGLLAELSLDPAPDVAAAALLALSRSRSVDALSALERGLGGPDAALREAAALGTLVRQALAHADGLDAVPESLVARARPQVTTADGRAWLASLDHFARWDRARAEWIAQQERLGAIARRPELARCVGRLRDNPALLQPPLAADGAPGMPMGWPEDARLVPAADRPSALLASGRLDELADQAFALDDAVGEIERVGDRVESLCQAGSPLTNEAPVVVHGGTDERPVVERSQDFSAWLGIHLGIDNHPRAYRPGSGEFLVGEDIEITLWPDVVLTYVDAAEQLDLGGPEPPVADGFGLSLRGGAVFSTAFFDDRSRPMGALALVVDRPLTRSTASRQPTERLRLSLRGDLLTGMGEEIGDVTRTPAPQVDAGAGLRLLRVPMGSMRPWPEADWRVDVHYVEHVFDDETAPPPVRRWLEPSVDFLDHLGDWNDELRPGLRAAIGARTTEEIDDLAAGAASLAPTLRWQDDELQADFWFGGGLTWVPDAADAVESQVVGGFRGGYRPGWDDELAITFEAGFVRDLALLGRNGAAGARDRLEGTVGLMLPSAMRDAMRLTIFAERTTPNTGDDLGWGGIAVFIPVGLIQLDQEITYEMRYLFLIDEARFENRAQSVVEARLSAGARF